MKSKVKRNKSLCDGSRNEIQYNRHKPKMIDLDTDESNNEVFPLEYNFSTKNALLQDSTYTFKFPDMWRTSSNKNVIGVRKINYFHGDCTFEFDLFFVWKNGRDFYYHASVIKTFTSKASVKEISYGLNEEIKRIYKGQNKMCLTKLSYYYSFIYFNNELRMIGDKEKPDYDQRIYINADEVNEKTKAFFNLYNKPIKHITAVNSFFEESDFYLYDISEFEEIIYERNLNFQVCCSFVAQSDIQYVGSINEAFNPIKYYKLNNENRYFTMKLKTFDNRDITIPKLENDCIIIEAQLL